MVFPSVDPIGKSVSGVIGVRATHHAGSVRRGPQFVLPGAQPNAGKVHRDGAVLELSAGELSLRVDTSQPWQLEFTAGGRVLTSVGEHGTGFELQVPLVFEAKVADSWAAKGGDGGQVAAGAYANLSEALEAA